MKNGARLTITCVLSVEQQIEYAPEFDSLRRAGIELVFQSSPEQALIDVVERKPWLVFVGMEIGWMEGLEFLALLTRRRPDLRGPVLLLPCKEDPFPAVIHSRDPLTGYSSTQEVPFGQVMSALIERARKEPSARRRWDRRVTAEVPVLRDEKKK